MKTKPIIVGIVGPSGSGKTTVGSIIKSKFKNYEHIQLDDYLKNPKDFPKKEGFINWEVPSNFKFKILLSHLKLLAQGKQVRLTKRFGGKKYVHVLKPKKYVLVEGILLLTNKDLKNLLQKKVFLDIPLKMIPRRRKKRSGQLHYLKYDLKVVIPEYKRHGVSQRKYADFVLDGTQPPDQIAGQLRSLIEK